MWEHGGRVYNFQGLRTFKNKFHPVWEPRYLAASGAIGPFVALADVVVLAGGGSKHEGFMARHWLVGLLLAFGTGPALAEPAIIDGGRFGTVRLSEPQGEMRGLVMLFSDHGAAATVDDAAATTLAAAGALVVEVDSDRYFAKLAGEPTNASISAAISRG